VLNAIGTSMDLLSMEVGGIKESIVGSNKDLSDKVESMMEIMEWVMVDVDSLRSEVEETNWRVNNVVNEVVKGPLAEAHEGEEFAKDPKDKDEDSTNPLDA
jgi:hypothetical protein